MSERNKRKILYYLVVISVILNFVFLVNVFALKLVSRRQQKVQPFLAKLQHKTVDQAIAAQLESSPKEISHSKKNLFQTSYELALRYEKKGDRAITIQEKTDLYSLALLEYAKMPKGKPHYSRLVRQAKERIQPQMLENSTLLVALGDTRRQVEQSYGKADRQTVDARYLPSGIVTYNYYRSQGLLIGISLNRVFSIKFCSNAPGLWYGIQIGDEFNKIKTLYIGKKVSLPGKNFGYHVDKLKTTFVFVDGDEKLDGIKILDKQYHGDWNLALK